MRNNAHLDDEQLLRFADGELSAKHARVVRRHIEACWQCRTGLNELQNVVSECVRYRKNVLYHFLPSPPAQWGDIYEGFARIDASQERVPRFVQFFESLRPALRWAPLAAAAVAVIVILVPYLRNTSSVQAAELLRKAVAAADAKPAKAPRRIRIRTAKVDFTRKTGTMAALPVSAPIEPLFAGARFDWNDPLSAKSFQNWREGVSDKRDEVSQANGTYQIHTTSQTSQLADARLTVRSEDFLPVRERLEFRNREWVEISDLGEEPAAAVQASAGRESFPPAASADVEPPEAAKAEELRVLAALHGIGADLGDPIDIARTGGNVEVSGVGVSPQRQQQIRESLQALPRVVVRFSDAAPVPSAENTTSAPVTSGTALPGQFQSSLEKQVGGRQRFEQFSGQVLDLSENMMSRAYAIRKLAQRFPPGAEARLTSEDRALLLRLHHEHALALVESVSQLQSKLSAVLAPMGAAPGSPAVQVPEPWQAGADAVFRVARRTEALLAALVGVTPDAVENPRLPSDVLSSLAELRATAAAASGK